MYPGILGSKQTNLLGVFNHLLLILVCSFMNEFISYIEVLFFLSPSSSFCMELC